MAISRTINALLVVTVLFPFVPTLLPGTDTQPWFLLVFVAGLVLGVALPAVGANAFRLSLSMMTAITAATILLFIWLAAAQAAQDVYAIPARVVSFLQFGAAAVWATISRYEWKERTLLHVLLLYVLFTAIYFAANGVIEDAVIRSRTETAGILFASGRGARTLSPEPSFFALHIFNVFVLASVLRFHEQLSNGRRLAWLLLVGVCLVSSFSAYGLLLLPVVAFALFPKTTALGAVAVVGGWQLIQSSATQVESVRAVQVVTALLQSGGSLTQLMLLDASFAGRIGSFLEYIRSFADHPVLGDAFSLYQGGGLISIMAAFGITAALLLSIAVIKALLTDYPLPIKLVLVCWLTLHVISGPIGIPILGVIFGKVVTARMRSARAPQPAGAGQLALPAQA